jgi:hypothetical protein
MARQADAGIDNQDCPITQPVGAVQKLYRELNFLLFQRLAPLEADDKEPASDESVASGRQIPAPHRDRHYNRMN